MLDHAYLLLPLVAAFLYALAAMALKAAGMRGLDFYRIAFVANWATAVAFLVFLRPAEGLIADPWWPPLVLGGVFFLGQVGTFVALSKGDVSLATPLLGTKVVMVALLLSAVFKSPVTWQTWVGAGAALAGIACLQVSDRRGKWGHVGLTLMVSLITAACFAMADSMIQVWSQRTGIGYARLVPPAMLVSALLSVGLLPLSRTTWHSVVGQGYRFLALGVAVLVAQAMLVITAIGVFGDAAGCNIVYGSRGLWTIVLVWWIGHRFGNTEFAGSRRVVVARLVGGTLIMLAIVMVFVR